MALLADQPNGQWAKLATTTEAGALVLSTTTVAPDTALLVQQPHGQWARIAAAADGDALLICVQAG